MRGTLRGGWPAVVFLGLDWISEGVVGLYLGLGI